MKYFLRNQDNRWESVDEFVFKNRKFAVTDKEEKPRYGDTYIQVDEAGGVFIYGQVSIKELGEISRFLGVTIPTGMLPNSLLSPATVQINKGGRIANVLHVLATGENWKKAA